VPGRLVAPVRPDQAQPVLAGDQVLEVPAGEPLVPDVQCGQEGIQVCCHERSWMPSSYVRINQTRRRRRNQESLSSAEFARRSFLYRGSAGGGMLVAQAYGRVRCTCRSGRGVYGLDAVQHRDISGYFKAEVLCLAGGEVGQEQAEDEPWGTAEDQVGGGCMAAPWLLARTDPAILWGSEMRFGCPAGSYAAT